MLASARTGSCPHQVVIGAREAAAGEVALRDRDGTRHPAAAAGVVLRNLAERADPLRR